MDLKKDLEKMMDRAVTEYEIMQYEYYYFQDPVKVSKQIKTWAIERQYGRKLTAVQNLLVDRYYGLHQGNSSVLKDSVKALFRDRQLRGGYSMQSFGREIDPEEKVNLNYMSSIPWDVASGDLIKMLLADFTRTLEHTGYQGEAVDHTHGPYVSPTGRTVKPLRAKGKNISFDMDVIPSYLQSTTYSLKGNTHVKYEIKHTDGALFTWVVNGTALSSAGTDDELLVGLSSLPVGKIKEYKVHKIETTLASVNDAVYMVDHILQKALNVSREHHRSISSILSQVQATTELVNGMLSGGNYHMTSTMVMATSETKDNIDRLKAALTKFTDSLYDVESAYKLKRP